MENDKLLPCPFCGGEVIIEDIGENKDDHYYMIQCKNPICNCSACFGERGSKEDFVNSWNTRKPMEWIAEKLENLPKYEFGVSLLTAEEYVKIEDLKKVIDYMYNGGKE